MLLAHRGVAQTFDPVGVTNETCTASRIDPPVHDLLENTLPSLAAAIAVGADVVEVDIHPTTDGEFAVFHDWTLDCRSNGSGLTRSHSLAELKALDIGWGYTADGGKSFPFRGKGVGLLPSLAEVLKRFPQQLLLINIKSADRHEGELLARYLEPLPAERRRRLAVYGHEAPISAIREHLPEVLTLSRDSLKNCLIPYFITGWTGAIPAACSGTLILLPINFASWIWGWPEDFVARLRSVGSAVYLTGPNAGGPVTGIDSPEALAAVPKDFSGGIWTDEIMTINQTLEVQHK